MAFRLTPPQIQWTNAYGNPLAGGQIFFYQSGTSTLAETFSDAALTIPNPNPIVLDASGSAVAPFLEIGQLYKIVLEDATGVVIYTVDPVSDPTSTGSTVTSSFAISDQAGTPRSIFLQTAGKNRFSIALDATAETGDNAGSNLLVTSYNDDGSADTNVVSISRSTGQVNFTELPSVNGVGVIPSGAIMPFAMAAPPAGWLAADGSLVSRATYPSLFGALGTLYGVGDGSTTFGIPDLRGLFIRGLDNGRGVDAGRTLSALQQHAFQDHLHNYSAPNVNADTNLQGGGTGQANRGATVVQTTGAQTGFPATETRPINLAMVYCIKT